MAGVPFGLRPMPFLASCVRHAEGGVGRGPLLSCAAVCRSLASAVLEFLPFSRSALPALFLLLVWSCPALLLLLRCPFPCRCACCCVCFVVPVRCAVSSVVVVLSSSSLSCFTCQRRHGVWLKMRTQTAERAGKRRSSCGCGGSVLLLALSPYHPIPPASKRFRGKIRSHEGKWKAALGVAH